MPRPAPPHPEPAPPLGLELKHRADVDDSPDLLAEIVLIRAIIRRLVASGIPDSMLKGVAELRHQIQLLCLVLRTRRDLLATCEGDERQRTLAQVLERMGAEEAARERARALGPASWPEGPPEPPDDEPRTAPSGSSESPNRR